MTTTISPDDSRLASDALAVILDAAAAIQVPRAAPPDSFVLHAPLELMARAGLLPLVDPAEHDRALETIAQLARAYEATGPGVEAPDPAEPSSLEDAAASLDAALRAGDADTADAAMICIARRADHRTVRRLVSEAIVDSLAAAGHAPIGLHLLPRVAGGALPAALLRGAVRTIASQPTWRLDWFREHGAARATEPLDVALRRIPHVGRPGSDFIQPLMDQAQARGVAAACIGPHLPTGRGEDASDRLDDSGRTLLRAAAWSMLNDDAAQAPYGWTHCLTMPQAVLGLGGDGVSPRTALAVAGTYVVGFRTAHGLLRLGGLDDASGTPIDAPGVPDRTDLATFAALHHDAHVVKYTLACLQAADADPAWGGTFLQAAAYLADWWWQHPGGV